jgi:hypothetical protein
MIVQDIVRVSKVKEAGLPLSPATFYAWHHTKKHPEIFVTIGGALFIDTKKFNELVERGRGKPCSRGRKPRARS